MCLWKTRSLLERADEVRKDCDYDMSHLKYVFHMMIVTFLVIPHMFIIGEKVMQD